MIVRSTKSCRFEKTVEMENIFTEEATDHYRTQIRNKNGDLHLVHILEISCKGAQTVLPFLKKQSLGGLCRQFG